MPRPNPRRAQAIVAAFCADRGVAYLETSLLDSYAQALGHLAAVGGGLASPIPAIGTTPGARAALTARHAPRGVRGMPGIPARCQRRSR